jgi:chromosome segregation ATPase
MDLLSNTHPIRVESKEKALKQMLATVKRDKVKIEETIDKLNDYKNEALERTWKQVNEYAIASPYTHVII